MLPASQTKPRGRRGPYDGAQGEHGWGPKAVFWVKGDGSVTAGARGRGAIDSSDVRRCACRRRSREMNVGGNEPNGVHLFSLGDWPVTHQDNPKGGGLHPQPPRPASYAKMCYCISAPRSAREPTSRWLESYRFTRPRQARSRASWVLGDGGFLGGSFLGVTVARWRRFAASKGRV